MGKYVVFALFLIANQISGFPFLPTTLREADVTTGYYRLPRLLQPTEYEIKIKPNLASNTFEGEVKIWFNLFFGNTREIKLHYNGLTDITLFNQSEGLDILNTAFEEEYDFVTFVSPGFITPGDHFIHLKYNGLIRDEMHGFYKSYYKQGNQMKFLGTTQLQPTHAREVFPCFDEPSFKAVFKISIDCPEGFKCISNMPEKQRVGSLIEFHPTPKMSSYLVAFVISEFVAATETAAGDERPFAVIGRPDARNMGNYAFNTGTRIINEFSTYMELDYYTMSGNLKMDQVGIPDFAAGAMENWGLITYREPFIMYDEAESSVRYRQQVIRLLTHEIAHMWFGNYATCHWWSDTWLNEGFANFFQHYLAQKVEDFGLDDQFLINQVQNALYVDLNMGSTPMSNPNVNSPQEISSQFGPISYSKGSAILRMMENLIGKENFRKSLSQHIKSKSFQVVTPDDLYSALENNYNPSFDSSSIKEIMSSWTEQGNYPLLTVDMNHENGHITLRQKSIVQTNNAVYQIPISYASDANFDFTNPSPSFIMNTTEHHIESDARSWVIFNIQQTGFYRVYYDENTRAAIIKVLNGADRNKIHKYNRAQIIDDAYLFVSQRIISPSEFLDTIQFLEKETEFNPWTIAYQRLGELRIFLGKLPRISKSIDDHILTLMKTLLDDIGFDEKSTDSNLRKLFKTNMLKFACLLEHKTCVENSLNSFKMLQTNPTFRVSPNLREPVYCTGIRHGEKPDFDFLWNKYVNENVVGEKSIILEALGCSKNEAVITEYLNKIIDNNNEVRVHDKAGAINSILNGNRENAVIVVKYFKEKLPTLKETFGSNTLFTFILNIAQRLNKNQLEELITFVVITPHLTPTEKTATVNVVGAIMAVDGMMEVMEPEIYNWLEEKYKDNGAASISTSLIILPIIVNVFINKLI